MDGVNAIEDQIERLDHAILASEDWAKSYKKKPEILAKLIKAEAKLGRITRKYFRELAKDRAVNFINWSMYESKAIKGYSFDVMVDVTEVDDEYDALLSVVHDPLLDLIAMGATTAEIQYGIDLGLNSANHAVMSANTKYVADLVRGVTDTTKARIQESISSSIHLGESTQDAIDRLRNVINDARRAELIARTETVRAYQTGITVFGQESNATGKIWEISSDPCEICADNDIGEIPFDDTFPSGDDEPPAHPNCRCDRSLVHSYE